MEYREEDFLMLSGLQHFKFCRRQWALIHIENQWADNFLTVDGTLMHKNAHERGFKESRGDRVIVRGLNVFSYTLGISGQCDVVEFLRSDAGIPMEGREGRGSHTRWSTNGAPLKAIAATNCSFALRQCV